MKNSTKYIEKAFGSEPEWTDDCKEDVDGAILRAINWYVGSDKRNYKKWVLMWMKEKRSKWTKEHYDCVRRCPQKDFKHFGHYCRILSRGFPNVDPIKKVVLTEINSLYDKGKTKKETPAEKVQVSPQQRLVEQVSEFAGELMSVYDKAVDSILTKGDFHKTVRIYQWLKQRAIGHKQAQMLGDIFAPYLVELNELIRGKDEQLNEGYSFMSKRQKTQLHQFMTSFIEDCYKYNSENKTVRRKRKINPVRVVSKVKYLKASKEYNIKSVDPVDIVDSKKVVVYNTKYNILSVYYAKTQETMTVKGTTIQNFCPDRSECRSIKKPEDNVRKIKNETSLEKIWNEQYSTVKKPTGRLNEHTIILKAFK